MLNSGHGQALVRPTPMYTSSCPVVCPRPRRRTRTPSISYRRPASTASETNDGCSNGHTRRRSIQRTPPGLTLMQRATTDPELTTTSCQQPQSPSSAALDEFLDLVRPSSASPVVPESPPRSTSAAPSSLFYTSPPSRLLTRNPFSRHADVDFEQLAARLAHTRFNMTSPRLIIDGAHKVRSAAASPSQEVKVSVGA